MPSLPVPNRSPNIIASQTMSTLLFLLLQRWSRVLPLRGPLTNCGMLTPAFFIALDCVINVLRGLLRIGGIRETIQLKDMIQQHVGASNIIALL